MIHVLVWTVFGLAIFFYLPFFSGLDIHYLFWVRQAITLCLLVIAFYVNSYILVPRFLLQNRSGYYFAIIVAILITIVLLDGWSEPALNLQQLLLDGAFLKRVMRQILAHRGENILQVFTLITAVLVLGISTSLAAVRKWQKDRQKREELEKDKITSELSLLKAQINPHFFFNTMNNIYILTQVDSDMAGQAIHRLSRMMRYLLYETPPGHTMLSQEIAFVKDYISLMQLRLTNAVQVNIEYPITLTDMPMAPMMFIPFLENAFKHGVSTTEQSHIGIRIVQRGTELDFSIKNSIMEEHNFSLETNNGIGLVNTRRRLDLLYPGRYKLEICERTSDNAYLVHLILDLS